LGYQLGVPRPLVLLIVALGFAAVPQSALAVVIERQGTTLVATGSSDADGFGITVWNTASGPTYAFVPNTSEAGPHGTVLEPGSGCTEPEENIEAVLCDMTGVTAVVIDAGSGDDVLFVSGTIAALTINCGAGIDSLQGAAGEADCEGSPRKVTRLMNARALVAAAVPFKRGRLKSLISSGVPLEVVPVSEGKLTAELSTTVHGKRKVIGRATKSGGPINVTLRLTKTGRALARATSRLKVRLVLKFAVSGRATVSGVASTTLS
jgi:hypothetical protein